MRIAESKIMMAAVDWEKDNVPKSTGALTRECRHYGRVVYEREVVLTEGE